MGSQPGEEGSIPQLPSISPSIPRPPLPSHSPHTQEWGLERRRDQPWGVGVGQHLPRLFRRALNSHPSLSDCLSALHTHHLEVEGPSLSTPVHSQQPFCHQLRGVWSEGSTRVKACRAPYPITSPGAQLPDSAPHTYCPQGSAPRLQDVDSPPSASFPFPATQIRREDGRGL